MVYEEHNTLTEEGTHTFLRGTRGDTYLVIQGCLSIGFLHVCSWIHKLEHASKRHIHIHTVETWNKQALFRKIPGWVSLNETVYIEPTSASAHGIAVYREPMRSNVKFGALTTCILWPLSHCMGVPITCTNRT